MSNPNNFPDIDATAIRSNHKLVDLNVLTYKQPGDTDLLQSREFYGTDEEINSMKESIQAKGILESPIVMENDDGQGYRVLEGNRRCHVLNLLVSEGVVATDTGKALTKVRVEVKPSVMNVVEDTFNDWLSFNSDADAELQDECREFLRKRVMLELGQDALIRNTQRLNWSPLEMARQIRAQMDAGEDLDTLSKAFGLATQTVRSHLSLLEKEKEMPEVIAGVDDGSLGISAARLLGNVSDSEVRQELLEFAKGDGESKPSTTDIKELINTKHQEAVDAGGEGIKTQDRKKRAKSSPKMAVRSGESILQATQALSVLRQQLLQDADNPVSENSAADLRAVLLALQWVVNPEDDTPLEVIILGEEEEEA